MHVEEQASSILVVDDNQLNLDLILSIFKAYPYKILYAPNGQVGVKIATIEEPDLILMDWAMPVLNGIDAVLKLKASDKTKDIPVIMTTGVMTEVGDLKEALHAGTIDYLRKPYEPLELIARVQTALRLGKAYEEIKQQKLEIENLLAKEKEYLQSELDYKERELTLRAVHDQDIKKVLKESLELTKSIKSVIPGDHLSTYNKLEKLLKQKSKGIDDNTFLLHFEKVHPSFYNALTEQFNGLTINDKKLSAYIKLGMSNKEIANLQHIELSTVKSQINRLKKKLKLGPEESLRNFFSQKG